MRSGRIALMALALSGCAHTRYVSTPCLTKQQYEEWKANEPPLVKDRTEGMKADEALPIAVGSAMRLRAWGNGMLGILEGCAG